MYFFVKNVTNMFQFKKKIQLRIRNRYNTSRMFHNTFDAVTSTLRSTAVANSLEEDNKNIIFVNARRILVWPLQMFQEEELGLRHRGWL